MRFLLLRGIEWTDKHPHLMLACAALAIFVAQLALPKA